MKHSNKFFNLKYILNSVYVLLILTIGYSCANKDNVISPETPVTVTDNNSVNGTVTFSDTNFAATGGIYIVGAYVTWPTSDAPASFDTIKISRNSSTGAWNKSYSYEIKNLANGNYSIVTGFRYNSTGTSNVLGIYGCDTSHNECVVSNTTKAAIVNNAGVTSINVSSWANIDKALEDFNIAKINGTVRFVDTLFAQSGGTYFITAYSSWPPASGPAVYDSIKLTRNSFSGQWDKVYPYQLKDLPNGNFAISVIYRKITGGASPIMGIYGCDTVHYSSTSTCPINPTKITINHGTRSFNTDLLSWADTTKRIF